MEKRIIISGFGGQGILSAGMILGYSALFAGKYITFFPSYGAEQRGGTSNCTVIIDDIEVASPVTQSPDILIAMNQPSVIKFEPWLEKSGIIIYNSSLVNIPPTRKDIRIFSIDANKLALELGDVRVANMIVLGFLLSVTKLFSLENLYRAIERFFLDKKKSKLVEINKKAAEIGFRYYS